MANARMQLKTKILTVDDYEPNLTALEAVLSSEYELIGVQSGQEAISILESRNDIDLVLMDVQMPKMDGYEAATRIKKIRGYEDVPIIFVTAIYKEDPHIKKGYAAGGMDYFSKPFDPDILRMKIGVYSAVRQKVNLLKEREAQILETEELLRTGRKLSLVLESLPVGVLIADNEGRVCQTNEQVAKICQAPISSQVDAYGEVLGWWDTAGKVIKDQKAPLWRALNDEASSHSEALSLMCADGTPKTIVCSASPLKGLDGHVVGAVVIIQDITESKKIEEDLESRITRLVAIGVELDESLHH
jgi:CheY-like chemotaxis protein